MTVRETWLLPNRRVYAIGLVIAGTIAAGLVICAVVAALVGWWWISGLSAGLGIAAAWSVGTFVAAMRQPRLAFGAEQLWVYLDPRVPIGVPIEIVECFFLGQGPSFLTEGKQKEAETQNIIVRLAESAVDWKHREVPDRYGHWCEGYITLRGAWCEPITRERMQALNRRLAEVHRERKARLAEQQAGAEQHSA